MEFDYVIVGAGSSGCVLAERLSRDGTSRVLLIEAGGENTSPLVSMPRGSALLWSKPDYTWRFPVEPQDFRPAGETWVYGRGLGGSSAVNGTWYYRGQPEDYDAWPALGATGWNWATFERCYREMEDFREPGADPSRGSGGPVAVTAVHADPEFTGAVLRAAGEMGLPLLEDVNRPGASGAGRSQMTVDRRGRRVSSFTAFVKGALGRANLTVRTGVTVRKVLFNGRRACGVALEGIAGCTQVRARREVIVCAGVLQSPKLLQLSGIGPADLLSRHGIAVLHANPHVGQHLADHMMISQTFRLRGMKGTNREFRGWRKVWHALRYYATRGGLMAYCIPEVSIMLSSRNTPSWPDIQMGVSSASLTTSKDTKAEPGRGVPEPVPGMTVTAFQLRPLSRGTVAIRSADPREAPVVHANWLSNPADCQTAIDLVKHIRRLVSQPSLAQFVDHEIVPGDDVRSDEDILDAARWLISSGLHGTATCRMGEQNQGVVDARLRVRGVTGLRVVDCSVMPTPISGNTNGPAMALAWRAAEMVLEDRI